MQVKIFQVLIVATLGVFAVLAIVEQCNARKIQTRIERLEKTQAKEKRRLDVTHYAVKVLAAPDPYDCTVGQRHVCEDL